MDLSDVDFTKILNTPQPKDINLDDIDWNAALGVPKAVDIASPNMMANPEQAAKAMKIAPDAGTTPVIANSNMKLAMEQAQRTKAARAINDSPALQQWIEQSDNPLVTAISNDDYEKLGDFAKAMTRIGGTAPPGHRFGEETVQRGTEAFEAQGPYAHAAASFALGDVSKEAQLREYEAKPKLPPADMLDLPGHVAGLLGGLAANFAYGGSKGAIVGGLLGAVGGPAGVATGATLGAHAGTLLDMALGSYGIAARNANQWRDSRGEPMGELSQQAVAIGSGALTAVVAGAAGPYAARAFSGAVTPLLMRAFGEKAVEASLSKAATNLAQAGVTGGALNVGLELAQTVPFEVARAMGSDPHSLIADPARQIEYAQNLGKAFVNGAVLFAGLAALPIGANYYMDRARIRQTVSDAQARQEAFDHAVGSLTRERSPETFSEFVKFTGGEDTAVKAATVAKLRETDPTAFDYVPDVDRKIAEALPHDGDLVVPTHEYFARTGEDHHAAVAADIRSGTGLTLNEAKALEEHWAAPPKEPVESPATIEEIVTPKHIADDPLGQSVVDGLKETTAKVRKALWLDPIIVPEAAGLSKAAFKRYSDHIQEAQRASTKAAFEIATKEIKRRETPLWRDTMARIGEEVAKEFEQRPDFAAERILRGKGAGEFGDFKTKFNQADVDEMFSAAEQDAMGASPHSLLRPDLITKEESIHPDAISELSGHGSGKELISELINLERDRRARGETPMQQYRRAVREETARRMEERHGRLDENVMREAMDLALSVEQIKVLHDDMQKIVDSGGLAVKLDREAVIRDVQDSISKMPATEAAKTRQFELQTAIAGGKAEAAGLKGDWAEAFQHKQVQFRNFLMARESKRIARDVAATERLLGQMGDLTKDSWDQEILDGAHALLKELGLTPPRSTENLLQALRDQSPDVRNYDTFVSHQKEAKGIDILPMPDNFPENYKEATASQIGYLRQVLESIAFHARDQQKISLGEQQEAFHGVMDAIYTNMADMRTKWTPEDLSGWQDWKTAGRNIDALLIRMEQLAAWFDKNDPLGPFTTAVIRPLKAGQHGKDAMLRSLADDFSKLPTSDKWSKSLQEKIANTVLLDTNGDPLRMTRGRLVAMILNMGNEQNMRTLVEGRNWDEGTVREFVRANAKKEDYEFAQGVWNMLDKYWEDVAEAGRKNTGVRPERVQATALDTPFGRYAGGYYPLFRERTWEPITKLENMYARGDVNPSVYQASAMRARTGAIYPVELSLDRLPGNLRNLAHTVHYTEPVRNVYKVLSDPEFRNLVTEKFGPEYKDLFYPWLKDIAQDGGTPDSRGEAWYNNISGIARANSVYMLMGWRPSTALIHGGAALSNSVYEVGPRGLAGAAKDLFLSTPEDILGAADSMFRNPQQHQSIWTWAMEQSGELRNRNHNLDMDIRREQDKALMGKTDWRALNAYHASWMVSTLDIMSAVPTWVAEYKAQRLEGRGHDDAVYVADRAVRQAHGSSGLVDQPQIQRMNEATKWFTTFYGYFNHNYNRQRDTGRMIADIPRVFSQEGLLAGFGEVGKAMAQSMAYLLAPAIIHELVRPHAQEDEGWAKWAVRSMALQLASTAPFVRDAAQAYVTGQAPRGGGPMGELLNAVLYRPFKDLSDAVNPDKDVSKDVVKHLLEVPGWLVGFPMSRYSAGTWQYIWDKAKGNETGDDMWRLAVDANPNERKQH